MPHDDAKEAVRKRLYERYDNHALDTGQRIQGEQFLSRVEELDGLDPEWTEGWLNWIYGHVYNRTVLDDRTRSLVAVAEHTVLGHSGVLPLHIRNALDSGAEPREILEVILQSSVYNGVPKAHQALAIFKRVMRETGAMEIKELVIKPPT